MGEGLTQTHCGGEVGEGFWKGGRGRNLVTATHRPEATSGGET